MEALGDTLELAIIGDVIRARIRGDVTEEMLRQRHQQILHISRKTGCKKLLLDDREMNAFSYQLLVAQRAFTMELEALRFRIAVVVPDSRLAYLARLQFWERNQRVFYTDFVAALQWLHEGC